MKNSISSKYTQLISTDKLRRVVACLLLSFISFSFLIEHLSFVEGDLLELVENTEKEENIKDKKVIVLFQNVAATQDFSHTNKLKYHYSVAIPLAISLDITTPPPRLG